MSLNYMRKIKKKRDWKERNRKRVGIVKERDRKRERKIEKVRERDLTF